MIIAPNIAGKKDPVTYVGAVSAYAGGSFGSLATSAPLESTVLYAMGAYQTSTTIYPRYGGVDMTSLGSTYTYGTCSFNYLTKVTTANGFITTSGAVGNGFGHGAAWFTGVDTIQVLQAPTAANGHSFTGSCLEGEMLVCLTGVPVGLNSNTGGTLVTKSDYYTHSNYGGAAIRIATGPTTVTFETSTGWGMGNTVLLLKP